MLVEKFHVTRDGIMVSARSFTFKGLGSRPLSLFPLSLCPHANVKMGISELQRKPVLVQKSFILSELSYSPSPPRGVFRLTSLPYLVAASRRETFIFRFKQQNG